MDNAAAGLDLVDNARPEHLVAAAHAKDENVAVADLDWLRGRGLDRAIAGTDALVLGVCGGYQMMARALIDDVESGRGRVDGLGWLDVEVTFDPEKVTRQRRGVAMGQRVSGYEIHHGRVDAGPAAPGWIHLDDVYGAGDEGAVEPVEARFLGTTLHGLFEEDGFRDALLRQVAERRGAAFPGSSISFPAARQARFDRLADLVEAHLDMERLLSVVTCGP